MYIYIYIWKHNPGYPLWGRGDWAPPWWQRMPLMDLHSQSIHAKTIHPEQGWPLGDICYIYIYIYVYIYIYIYSVDSKSIVCLFVRSSDHKALGSCSAGSRGGASPREVSGAQTPCAVRHGGKEGDERGGGEGEGTTGLHTPRALS